MRLAVAAWLLLASCAPVNDAVGVKQRGGPADSGGDQILMPRRAIWLSAAQIAALPVIGAAWTNVLSDADGTFEAANLGLRNFHNVHTYAAALVAARLDSNAYRAKVRDALREVVSRAPIDDVLAASRRLATYVIAADIIDLPAFDPTFDAAFRVWLAQMLHQQPYSDIGGTTVRAVHERRPNSWGAHAAASRIAVDAYLGDEADLREAANIFKGWLGDRSAYASFTFNDPYGWHADSSGATSLRRGVNPVGAQRDGHDLDGVIPDDQRLAGDYRWPPPKENGAYAALQGAAVAAEILSRMGQPAWRWEESALLRAFTWLHTSHPFEGGGAHPAEGDDTWQPWLVNRAYSTSFPTRATDGTSPGKNMGYCDWTHAPP